jgi:hypothetical protein
MQRTTSALKNKGRRIRAERINFIEQQEVNETTHHKMPLLLKSVNR